MKRVFQHRPVMTDEVVRYLNCRPGGRYVDGTVGGGGHAEAILRATGPDGLLIGLDLDEEAIEAARAKLKKFGRRAILLRENFSNIKAVLASLEIEAVDGILLDLGVSLHQLKAPRRGFGFRVQGPLDMRMDRGAERSAVELVNTLDVKELADIIRRYGQERFAVRIARAIVKARSEAPVETTEKLKEIILSAIPKRFQVGRIHPATRTFQALRIAVNRELENLERALSDCPGCLARGGRFVVISYHSLEARMVKRAFREASTGCICPPEIPRCVCGRTPEFRVVTSRAVRPSKEEVEENPSARSALLRALERL